jgi:hypothetical protein
VSYDGGRRGETAVVQRALTGEYGDGARASDARRQRAILSRARRTTPRRVAARWATSPDKRARCQPQRH